MSSRIQTIENMTGSFTAFETLIDSLSEEEWATQSLCPEWDVRGVVTHLASIEHGLHGWLPGGADKPLPFEAMGAFGQQAAEWDLDQLITETKAVFSGRREDFAAATDELFASASATPVGPGTYQRFMDVRTFDFWVHERDITTPIGRPSDDGGPIAEIALDEVHNSIGYIAGKKIGLPDGMSMAVRLTGPVQRDIFVNVDGRAAKVDHLDAPSVELTTDSLTFVQLACGRIDPEGPISDGRITWSGDQEWGEKAARNLKFTM